MHAVDIVFLLLLLIVQPWLGRRSWRRWLTAIAAGEAPDRPRQYAVTMLIEWTALAVLAACWWFLERPWAWLGLHDASGPWVLPGVGIALAGLAVFGVSAVQVRRSDAAKRREMRDSLGDLAHFMPRTARELKGFMALSVTAGIVEELLYRGFLLWLFMQWMPTWLAVLVSSIGFGLAHSYQGAAGIVRTALVGAAFAALYLATGNIWWPMLFHALLDIVQGIQLHALFQPADTDEAATATR